MPDRTLAPGSRVGHYTLGEPLPGDVLFAAFRATDTDRAVVVQALLPVYADDPEIVAALRRGCDQAIPLRHPSIAAPLDAGSDPQTGTAFYIVTEPATGATLAERLRRPPALTPRAAVDILIALAGALQYAHGQGVAHGDLRPAHVRLGENTPAKLAGFGIGEAQLLAASDFPDRLEASAPYLAPEVWATGTASASADLYALGVVLFECLTGRVPYPLTGTVLALAHAHTGESVPPMPNVPRALDGMAQKLMAKKIADRYPSPDALLADLRNVQSDLRYGRSLDWSPLDPGSRPPVPEVRTEWSDAGTAVMPTRTVAPVSPVPTERAPAKPVTQPVPKPMPVPEPPAPLDSERISEPEPAPVPLPPLEEPVMSAAMPASRRKEHSFNWLLPLNLFLATVFVATCGYVVNLTLVAFESPGDVIVPNLVGKSLTEAKTLGLQKKFVVEVIDEKFSDKYAEDTIYEMRPEPGRHIRENKKVTVVVSKGPRMVTVPDVYDVSYDRARRVLEKVGLRVGEIKKDWDIVTAKGNVMQQVPSEGENRPRGTTVDLVLSKGAEPPEVLPDVPVTPADSNETDPPADPGADEQEQSLTLNYDVPKDAATHVIRIDVTDSRGTRNIITESHNAGDKVPLDVVGYGKKITFRVYDNDILQDTIAGPPWPGEKGKTP